MKKGLPRSHAPRVLERRREAPRKCCTPGWISAASVSTSTCLTHGPHREGVDGSSPSEGFDVSSAQSVLLCQHWRRRASSTSTQRPPRGRAGR